MKVTLRKREKGGKVSLYLDYYHKGKRNYEYLRLYLNPKPRTKDERVENKKILELAETLRMKRQLDASQKVCGFEHSDRDNIRFLDYFEREAERRRINDNNYGNWKSALKHLRIFDKTNISLVNIDDLWIESLKSYLIHDAKTKNNAHLSQNTCFSYFNKVRACLNQAIKDGILSKNPASTNEGLKEAETKKEFLTLEELKKVAATKCENPILKRAFLFSTLTGLRFSDISKLIWEEVEFSETNGYYVRFQQKKTNGHQTLPISQEAYELLLDERDLNEGVVFPELQYSSSLNQRLKEWMIRAGIEKHITFHCARHTYATLQLGYGTDIYTVSKLLGHKHLRTTEVYAKIIDEKKLQAANRIKLT
ncbi:MAG: site-specific integrase [Bacteroidetes bacterium]|nr:site-specific integrase [Bacteroidota bacterium]